MIFSLGLLIWWICSLLYQESEELTYQGGGIIVGEIMVVASAVNFAWTHML